ncbi:hypothetical protein [Salinigranum sp. GCM10025319]
MLAALLVALAFTRRRR